MRQVAFDVAQCNKSRSSNGNPSLLDLSSPYSPPKRIQSAFNIDFNPRYRAQLFFSIFCRDLLLTLLFFPPNVPGFLNEKHESPVDVDQSDGRNVEWESQYRLYFFQIL